MTSAMRITAGSLLYRSRPSAVTAGMAAAGTAPAFHDVTA
jgi:hypothetical protein